MTSRYTLSPRAQTDLDEIWDYTAKRWNIDQAETYIRRIHRTVSMFAEQPAAGRACLEVRPGYYRYPSGSHILFYRLTDNGIDVVRILHERMDFDRHL